MTFLCHDVLLHSKLDVFQNKINDAKFKENNLTISL